MPIHDDIRSYKHDGTPIDLLTGGFPCQPFSTAGKQRGTADDRYLWPEMLKIISEARPNWIIGENVAGIVRMELDNCISDLEAKGYECQPFIIPACAKDAPHRRDRVWIIAHSEVYTRKNNEVQEIKRNSIFNSKFRGNTDRNRPHSYREICESVGFGTIHGVPNRTHRLKSLGNAIVPQVVVPIMEAIKEINKGGR